jgi:hypothetical protein
MDGWPGDRIAVFPDAGRLAAAWSVSQGAALTIACLARTISVMSKSVSVIITDDLDGSENAETVSFAFDGVTYEIDLGKKNRSRLKKALAPFIEAGRRAPRSGRRRGASRPGGSPADRSALRAWARAAGLKVSERGRISADIMRQYDAAH